MRSVLLFSFLAFCFVGYGQIINFPDANFKNALVNTLCVDTDGNGGPDADADLDNDGEVDVSEAMEVTNLIVSNNEISNLEGIGNFINLEIFFCSNNQLKVLNIEGLTKLVALICDQNQLISLDAREFSNLSTLICNENQLTNLDVRGLSNLFTLHCSNNQLTNLQVLGLSNLESLICNKNKLDFLDIQGLSNLSNLDCSTNQLTNLQVLGLSNLESLICTENKLASLDVTGLTNLISLSCSGNQLTSLDVQGLPNLIYLYCEKNKLTSLNVQGLTNLIYLICSENELTNLDLQGLTNLEIATCFENKLTYLNVKGLTNLIALGCEKNKLTSLDVLGLTNLKRLTCNSNQLISIDISGLSNLMSLYCQENELTFVDVQGLSNLEILFCSQNKLTNLKLHGLSSLTYLNCDTNQLASLDIKELSNLTELSCNKNELTSLDLKGFKKLNYLWCNENELTNLDVEGLTDLEIVSCDKNKLSSLNLLGFTKLIGLYCEGNQLESLLIKGTQLSYIIKFENNPNLQYICCNDEVIYLIQNSIEIYGLSNCEVNSYCTFTPGDKFYVIKGENKYDDDNNGCDNLDFVFPSIKYLITDSITTATFISNSTGSYSIPIQAGTYTITPIIDNPENFEVSPSFLTTTFPNSSDTINQDFCITPKGFLNKINITIIPLFPPARPGFDASYSIIWENVGNQIESGTLNFTYEETLLDYISATQTEDLKSDGIVSWYFNNLLPFEKREITVTLKVNRPTDTPAVNAGDKLYLTASILDNIFTLENTVVGSYDPNDKTCLQGDRVHPDMIGKYVDYLIRFENTGNYAAENVVIKDIIDTITFDVSTLKITDASHEVYTRIEGNKVEFIFENINLPFDDANNDGYIAFKIKTLPSLVLGDSLKNLADIYFDYNFPIRTNEAQTTVAFPVFTKDITTEVNIYPNPVTDVLYLDSNDHWSKAEIFDIAGRIMRSVSLNGQSMDVSGLESGTYFIRLKDGDRVGLVKFVKI